MLWYWTPVLFVCYWFNLSKWFLGFISFWPCRFRFHVFDKIWCHDDGSKINIVPLTHTSIVKYTIGITYLHLYPISNMLSLKIQFAPPQKNILCLLALYAPLFSKIQKDGSCLSTRTIQRCSSLSACTIRRSLKNPICTSTEEFLLSLSATRTSIRENSKGWILSSRSFDMTFLLS